MLDAEWLAPIRRVLEAHPVSFAMLFGSAAHGTHTEDSDIGGTVNPKHPAGTLSSICIS